MPDQTWTIEFDADSILKAIEDGAHDGMASAARFIVDEMRRRAPKQTTQLTESIDRSPITGSFLSGTLNVTITAGAPYAGYVEHGTPPHPIDPKPGRIGKNGRPAALRWGSPGGYVFARHVNHPGTKAQPFFFATVEENREFIAEQIGKGIRRAMRKIGE